MSGLIMNKLLNFPKKKPNLHLLVPETEFQFMTNKLMKSAVSIGRSQGFLVGTIFSGIVNLIFYFIF